MTQRLHVLLEDDEIAEIRRIAGRQGTTVAAWVRQALRVACQEAASADSRRKLSAVHGAAQGAYPVGLLPEMRTEIESGYLRCMPRS
jgi:hypothetical protein